MEKMHLLVLLSGFLLLQAVFAAQSTGINASKAVAVNLFSELNNSNAAGFNFTHAYFQSNYTSQCRPVLISQCNNNNPSQFVCINDSYYQSYAVQKEKVTAPTVCPEYFMAGTISCAVHNGYCVVTDTMYQHNATNFCPYGHICGNPSNGCAQPGAIYNCPNEPAGNYSNTTSTNSTARLVTAFRSVWNGIISFLHKII